MPIALSLLQAFVALVILNVWLRRAGRETAYRGGDAKNLEEEFAVYGLPAWSYRTIGALKILCAAALLVGLWIEPATFWGAAGLAVLMGGAVLMHAKVRDPLRKTLPALVMLLLSICLAAV